MRSTDRGKGHPDGTMTVRCRFFATFAELLGRETYDLELPWPATVADAVRVLRMRLDQGGQLPANPMAAVNREHVTSERQLEHGDELALLPPLAGG
jgi:molybdopterin converting factor small subunit